jgi:hypothetical protein
MMIGKSYFPCIITDGKELPPELIYTGNTMNSKYREDEAR